MNAPRPLVHLVATLLLLTAAGCGGSDGTGPEGGNGGGNGDPEVATVAVTPSSVTLAVDETRQLTATARTATGQTVPSTFTWTSQGESIATVSGSGLVRAEGPGSTTITATATTGAVQGSATVTVAGPPDAPSDLIAIAGGPDVITLSWTDNSSDEEGFEVQRSLEEANGFSTVGTTDPDVTEYVDESVEAQTTYYYRVRATGEGEPSGFSNVASATTTAPVDPGSPFECEREGYPCAWTEVEPTVFDRSDALGDEVLLMFEDGQTVAEALAWLEAQPEVTDAIAGENVLRFRLQGGRPTWVFHPNAILIPEGAPPAPEPTSAFDVRRSARDVVGDEPKMKRALVMSPYQWQVGPWDPSGQLAAMLGAARGYDGRVDYLVNSDQERQIDVAQFTDWDAYDVIHVFTHGNQICEEGQCTTVVLAGRTDATTVLSIDEGGVDLAKIEYGDRSTSLSTDFFREQYPQGLPDTIVYISACRTTRGEDLELALAGSGGGGGGVYLGWTQSVWADTAMKAALAFFQSLIDEGVPSTSAFLSLREGEDLTIDRMNNDGSFATLDLYRGGDDLRVREIAFVQNPLTKEDLPEEDFPYPVVGQPEDGEPDRIPYRIKVEGVEGDPSDFVVNVMANGFSADPKPLAAGEATDGEGNVWEVKGEVLVPFDAQQEQEIELEVRVDLPEGGESRWDEKPRLGNPELHFRSTIASEGGMEPIVALESRVEAEIALELDSEFEDLMGDGLLSYVGFDVDVEAGCTVTETWHSGQLHIPDVDLEFNDGEPTVPEQVLLYIPPSIDETLSLECNGVPIFFPLIHYFAGFYSFHGGELCGAENEVDEGQGALVITDWAAGSDEVIARKIYDRSCTEDEATFTEMTTIELVYPMAGAAMGAPRPGGLRFVR